MVTVKVTNGYYSGGGGFLGLGAAPEVINIAGGLEHLWAVTDRYFLLAAIK